MPENVLRTVPALGERRRPNALIAQFKVLPESEVLLTLGGQKRKHSARERKPGMFLQAASHLGYIKTTTLPPLSMVSLAINCSHTPRFAPIFAQNTKIPKP